MFLFLCFYNSEAQKKGTLYFNAKWEESEKVNASFYRPLPLKTKGDYEFIEDYYMNGNIQMKGWSHKTKESTFKGEVTWYFKNGNKSTVRNYKEGKFNGVHTIYYENGSVKSVGTYVDNKWEGEAKGYNEEGKLIYDVVYKKNKAYQGTTKCFLTYEKGEFVSKKVYYEGSLQLAYEEIYNEDSVVSKIHFNRKGEIVQESFLENNSSMKIEYYKSEKCGYVEGVKRKQTIKNGNIEGDEFFYDEEGNVIAKGVNKDNKPYDGTFIEVYGGVYKTYSTSIYKKGEKIKEDRVVYNQDGTLRSKMLYKKEKPYKGIELDGEGNLISYKGGKLHGKQVTINYKKEKYIEFYENGKRTEVEDHSFYVNDKTGLKGAYKKGKPYEGYFKKDFRELTIVDYYEKGEKKFQYSPQNIIDMDTDQLNLSVQSTYKNNKIYEGETYTWGDGSLTIDRLEKGKVVGFTLWVFAIHYANNITVKKIKEGYIITEGINTDLKVEFSKEKVALVSDNKIIAIKEYKHGGLANKRIIYYEKEGELNTQEFLLGEYFSEYEEVIRNQASDFLIKAYNSLSPEEYGDNRVLNELRNIFTEDYENELYEFTERQFIAALTYDENGKIKKGAHIKKIKEGYIAKTYSQGKLINTIERPTIKVLKTFFKNYF